MKSHLFTFIIAYKHRTDRIHNLRRVLDWVSGFGGVEIIIVEQDDAPRLPSFTIKGVKHVFTKSEMPFNKSWAFNVGLKYATTETIVFGDCDLIMDPHKMIEALKKLENYDCVSPYSRVIDLNPNEVNMNLEQMATVNRPGRGETDIQKICLAGGIIMYRKEAIYKIGGWCEDFIGWGGEDDFQSHKSKMFLNWYEQMGTTCYHLWHERGAPDPVPYQRNLELLNKLVSLPQEELYKYNSNGLQKMGIKNKYDK
jgi:predicted glycosyltransferase involved in capsule biosynthesis